MPFRTFSKIGIDPFGLVGQLAHHDAAHGICMFLVLTEVFVRFPTDAGDFAEAPMDINDDVRPISIFSSGWQCR